MSSVTFDEVWVSLADDLTEFVTGVLTGLDEVASRPTDVRTYAGGRLRSIVRPAEMTTITVSMTFADRATADTLRSWRGRTVLLREPRGRRVWGTYGDISISEIPGADIDAVNVAFVLSAVTVSEVV